MAGRAPRHAGTTLFGRRGSPLGTLAARIARLAIVETGRASAADWRATFEPQRRILRDGAGTTT